MNEPHWTRPYNYKDNYQAGVAHLYFSETKTEGKLECFAECGEFLFTLNSDNPYMWVPSSFMPQYHCEQCERIGIMRELAE